MYYNFMTFRIGFAIKIMITTKTLLSTTTFPIKQRNCMGHKRKFFLTTIMEINPFQWGYGQIEIPNGYTTIFKRLLKVISTDASMKVFCRKTIITIYIVVFYHLYRSLAPVARSVVINQIFNDKQ